MLALLIAFATNGQPAAPPVKLDWDAPDECPTQAVVETAVGELLREAGVEGRSVEVQARVDARATGYRLELALTTSEGTTERSLDADSCAELAETAALLVAMAVEPSRSSAAGEDATAPEQDGSSSLESGSPVVPLVPLTTEVTPSTNAAGSRQDIATTVGESLPSANARPSGRRPIRVVTALQAGFGYGPLPRGGATLDLRVGVGGRHVRVAVVGGFWPDVEAPSESSPSASVRARLWTGGLRICGVPAWRTAEFPVCGGADAGAMRAFGESITNSDDDTTAYVAVAVSVSAEWWFRRWVGLSAQLEGLATLLRPRFYIDPADSPAHTAAAGGVRLIGGVTFRLH